MAQSEREPAHPPADLPAGRVGRPHGLDGSFYVTDARPRLLTRGAQVHVNGRSHSITRRAGTDGRPIVRLEQIEDRTAAEALKGRLLVVPRAEAPPLEPGEWWASELEGCQVIDGRRTVGEVVRLVELPSCEALEVRLSGSPEKVLVPMVRDAIRSVDVGRCTIDVDMGFLES